MTDKQFNPDWVTPPGGTIGELLEEYRKSTRDLADMLDLSLKDAELLLSGDLELTDEIAEKLAKHLGAPVHFWKNYERNYRDGLAAGKKKWD